MSSLLSFVLGEATLGAERLGWPQALTIIIKWIDQ